MYFFSRYETCLSILTTIFHKKKKKNHYIMQFSICEHTHTDIYIYIYIYVV